MKWRKHRVNTVYLNEPTKSTYVNSFVQVPHIPLCAYCNKTWRKKMLTKTISTWPTKFRLFLKIEPLA